MCHIIMTQPLTGPFVVISRPPYDPAFRLLELLLCFALLILCLPLWGLHFLYALFSRRQWLMREHVLGAGGRVITLLRTRPLGSRFFDHPMISESPRLWFIPLGHLSLVGPAPVPPEWANQVESRYLERLRVRPGLVNTHFVRSRVNIAFADEAELALEDANSLGFKKKVALLLRSIPALVLGSKENAQATEDAVTLFGLSMANRSRD